MYERGRWPEKSSCRWVTLDNGGRAKCTAKSRKHTPCKVQRPPSKTLRPSHVSSRLRARLGGWTVIWICCNWGASSSPIRDIIELSIFPSMTQVRQRVELLNTPSSNLFVISEVSSQFRRRTSRRHCLERARQTDWSEREDPGSTAIEHHICAVLSATWRKCCETWEIRNSNGSDTLSSLSERSKAWLMRKMAERSSTGRLIMVKDVWRSVWERSMWIDPSSKVSVPDDMLCRVGLDEYFENRTDVWGKWVLKPKFEGRLLSTNPRNDSRD